MNQAGLTSFEKPFPAFDWVENVEKLSLENFGLAFIILSAGTLIATIVFITEKISFCCGKKALK